MKCHSQKKIKSKYTECLCSRSTSNKISPPTPSPIVTDKLKRTFKWVNLTGNTIINYTISKDGQTATIHIEGLCTGPQAPVGTDYVNMTEPLPTFIRPKFNHKIIWAMAIPPATTGTMIMNVNGNIKFGDQFGEPITVFSGGAPDIVIFPGSYTYHI